MPIIKDVKPSTSNEAVDLTEDEPIETIEKIFRDISKTSASKQIIMGATTGWLTGFLAMKVGKVAAFAVGGGIILLEFANELGYVKINWNKISKGIDKVTDRVEEKITGKEAGFVEKVERFVDKKVDKAEELAKKGKNKAKRWYSSVNGKCDYRVKDVHIFTISFIAGVALGIGTS